MNSYCSETIGYCSETIGYCSETIGYCSETIGYCSEIIGYCSEIIAYPWGRFERFRRGDSRIAPTCEQSEQPKGIR
jgi:hypothetical protein